MSHFTIRPLLSVDESLPIAGFDLDCTLIKPKSGNKYKAKSADDWKFLYDVTEKTLVDISTSYRIVVFTNQGEKTFNEGVFREKIGQIQKFLPFIEVRVSHGKDEYRKPETGMFRDSDNRDGAFYVGDAAGRDGDHSADDKLFAMRLGIPFYTPEEYFLGEKNGEVCDTDLPRVPDGQFVVCMTGYPASGKSTFSRKIAAKYDLVIVGNDADKKKIERELKAALKDGRSCVIDVTTPDVASRAYWINITREFKVPIVSCRMITNCYMSMYYNTLRDKHIPDVVYWKFRKAFVMPSVEEGFDAVYNICGPPT